MSLDIRAISPAPIDDRDALIASLPTMESRAYRTGRNLILATLVIVVVNRLFTEVIPVLPRAFNFIDVPLLGILLAYSVVALPPRPRGFRPGFVPGMIAFAALWGVSVIANLDRVHPYPALLFLYGFLGPLLFYALAYRFWPVGQAAAMSKVILWLGLLQFAVVVLIDLPRFAANRNPDLISGTFGENAYQLVFFLLIFGALVAGIGTFERGRTAARMAPALLAATFVVIFLAQYRSLLVTTAFAAALVASMVGLARGRGMGVAILMILALALAFGFIVSRFPLLRFDQALLAIREDPGSLLSGKLDAASTLGPLYAEDVRYPIVGTGPGTYSSRAWRTFALLGTPGGHADVAGPYVSALTNGNAYRTDVSDRYVVPQVTSTRDILGSRVLAGPFTSYVALLAEVGIFGFLIVMMIYLTALSGTMRRTMASMRRAPRGDPLPALLLAATAAVFVLLQAALLDNWLEGARVTIPSWILVAVTTKEFQARRLLAQASRQPRREGQPRLGRVG